MKIPVTFDEPRVELPHISLEQKIIRLVRRYRAAERCRQRRLAARGPGGTRACRARKQPIPSDPPQAARENGPWDELFHPRIGLI